MEGKRELTDYLFQTYQPEPKRHSTKEVHKLIEELPYPEEDFSISSLSPQKEDFRQPHPSYIDSNHKESGRIKTQSNYTYDTNSNEEITPAGSLRGSFTPNCMHKFMDWSKQNVNVESSKNIFPQVTGPSIDIYSQDNFNLDDSEKFSSKRKIKRKFSRGKGGKRVGGDSMAMAQKLNELTQTNSSLTESLERQNGLVSGYRKRLSDLEKDCEHLLEIRKESEKEKNEILKSVSLLKEQLSKKDELITKQLKKFQDIEVSMNEMWKENSALKSKLELFESNSSNANSNSNKDYEQELLRLQEFYEKEIGKVKGKERELRDELKTLKDEGIRKATGSPTRESKSNSQIHNLTSQLQVAETALAEEKRSKKVLENELNETQIATERTCNQLMAEVQSLKDELIRREKAREKEIPNLKKIAEFKQTIENLSKENTSKDDAIQGIQNELSGLEEKLNEKIRDTEYLRSEVQSKELEYQSLVLKLQKASTEICKAREEGKRKEGLIQELTHDVKSLKERFDEKIEISKELEGTRKSLEERERELEMVYSKLEEAYENSLDRESLLTELEVKEKSLAQLSSANEEMQKKYRELDSMFTEYQTHAEKSQKSSIKGIEEKYDGQLKEREKKNIELYKENKVITEKLREVEESNRTLQSTLESKSKALTQKSSEIKTLLANSKEVNKKIELLEKNNINSENSKVAQLNEKVISLEKAKSGIQRAFEEGKREKERLIKDVIELQTENTLLKDKIQNSQSPPKGNFNRKSLERTASTSTFYANSPKTATSKSKDVSMLDLFQPELLSNDETLEIISRILSKVVRSKEMVKRIGENQDFRDFSCKLIQGSFDNSEFLSISESPFLGGRESNYSRREFDGRNTLNVGTPLNTRGYMMKGSFF